MAHTHAAKLKGAISLGGGCHHMFDREWLDQVNHKEYPFEYAKPRVLGAEEGKIR